MSESFLFEVAPDVPRTDLLVPLNKIVQAESIQKAATAIITRYGCLKHARYMSVGQTVPFTDIEVQEVVQRIMNAMVSWGSIYASCAGEKQSPKGLKIEKIVREELGDDEALVRACANLISAHAFKSFSKIRVGNVFCVMNSLKYFLKMSGSTAMQLADEDYTDKDTGRVLEVTSDEPCFPVLWGVTARMVKNKIEEKAAKASI